MKKLKKERIYPTIAILLVLIGSFMFINEKDMGKNIDEKRLKFISEKEDIQKEMMGHGNYACCLEKACTYCIEKSPGHGEGAVCNCLGDIMNGVHPCGECIGEILEGHGNKFLAPYFATAIAEKTGELAAIQRIISEKYDISAEEQI